MHLSEPLRRGVILVAALLGMGITFALGQWQLGRAAQKQALAEQRSQRMLLPRMDLSSPGAIGAVAGQPEAHWHRPVRISGRWLAARTVYLDNRPMDGRPGFHVLTPLRTDAGPVVMVQRGWLARDVRNRTALPPVPTPDTPVAIDGRIAPPPSRLLELGPSSATAPAEGDSPIRQNLDLTAFALQTGLDLVPFTVLMTSDAPDGLLRRWPDPASGVAKHHGYAFQWFGLCALIGVLYVWFQLIAPRRRN